MKPCISILPLNKIHYKAFFDSYISRLQRYFNIFLSCLLLYSIELRFYIFYVLRNAFMISYLEI